MRAAVLFGLLFISLAHATIVLNSSDLMNTTIQANETVFIADWNATIEILNNTEIVYVNETVYVNQTFEHQEYNLSYNETKDLYGNWTVHGPPLPACEPPPAFNHSAYDLTPNETKDLYGNWTVRCQPPNITKISFNETRVLAYNETEQHNFSNDYCNISFRYTAPQNSTPLACNTTNTTICTNTTLPAYSFAVEAMKNPGECYSRNESNATIRVCCAAAPACTPATETKTVYETLLDLGDIDRESCVNPIYLDNTSEGGEWLCLDKVTQYCPAEVALDGGCPGCTQYAVDAALAAQSDEMSLKDESLANALSALDNKNSAYATLDANFSKCIGEKRGCQLAVDDWLFRGILLVVILIGYTLYMTYFHKDNRLPIPPGTAEHDKVAYKPKFGGSA